MVTNQRRLFEMHALNLCKAFGYLYEYEAVAIQLLAASLPEDAKIVNFGAGTGTSALAMVSGNPTAKVWTVDISPGSPIGGLENERNAFAATPLKLPEQILGCSWEVGKAWKNGKLDMVFIDGDHSAPAVRKDIEAWLPNVKPGGLVLFHDYERDVWPDVKMVVDELMKDHQEIMYVETLKVFIK